MKILHCVNKMDMGGIETLLMRIFKKVVDKGVVFDFLCVDKQEGVYDKEIKRLGGQIFYLPELHYKNLFLLFKNLKERKQVFSELSGYDAIHIHASQAFSAYNRAKYAIKSNAKKIIVHSHNMNCSNVFINNIFKKKLAKLNLTQLACSDEAGKWMYTTPYEIIYNAIEMERFEFNDEIRKEVRAQLGIKKELVIGHVGRYTLQKNHGFLLEILKELSALKDDVKLLLIGKGELDEEISGKINALGLQNKIIQCGTQKDVGKFMQAMDVFCFPSIFEGLGIVTIEAQATGLPCLVSTKVPKIIDISNNVQFLEIGEKDKQAWVDALVALAKLPRKAIVPNTNYNNFCLENAVNSLLKIYGMNE